MLECGVFQGGCLGIICLLSEKYKLNFISGEINRSIQGEVFGKAMTISTVLIDSIYNNDGTFLRLDNPSFNIDRDNYTFSRNLTAFNVEFPIKKNMSLGFSMLKSKDNTGSM